MLLQCLCEAGGGQGRKEPPVSAAASSLQMAVKRQKQVQVGCVQKQVRKRQSGNQV